MLRTKMWLTACGMFLSATFAYAQGPGGYPGYPTPPYGMPQPMMPVMPYANPGTSGRMAPSLPTYGGGGAKPGADQPYLVQPDPKSDAVPPAESGPYLDPASYIDAGPNEPYTLYEGRRMLAEIKQDNTQVWVQANFIHWWVRRDSTPALVTTGNPGPTAGTLGNADTIILLGDGAIGPKEFSGIQVAAGMWLDDDKLQAFEVGGFWLGNASREYYFASDSAGNPVLAQPVLAPGETSLLTAFPGVFKGDILVSNGMAMHGVEANCARNLYRLCGWSIDGIFGARYIYLNDTLTMLQNITVLPGGGGIPFAGALQGPGSNFQLYDSFNVTNRFYGGQFGARFNWTHCRWDVGAVAKIAMGVTTHAVNIDGSTTLNAVNGTSTTTTGSSLAQSSNIGSHNSTDFSVVPEVNATLGYQLTPHLRLLLGYNIIYWNRIARAGDQIDRNIDLTQSPTDPTYVPNRVGTSPLFPNNRTDFWIHGLNLGVELRF